MGKGEVLPVPKTQIPAAFLCLAPTARQHGAAPDIAKTWGGRHHFSIPSKLVLGAGAPFSPSTPPPVTLLVYAMTFLVVLC